MPKVSVIISAYNVEKYIEKSLKSVCNQTLRDIEILAVDDGSTDKTKEIISEIARTDTRIRLLPHEENKGLMLARKTGYDNASGDYIMFLDGDDYYNENACEIAYVAIVKENTDILQFGVTPFYTGNSCAEYESFVKDIHALLNFQFQPIRTTGTGGLHNSPTSLKIHHSILNKIYTAKLVQKVSAVLPNEHIYMAEDMFFNYIAFFYAHSIACINPTLYNYRIGSGISTTTSITDTKMLSIAKGLYLYSFVKKWTTEQGAYDNCKTRLDIFYDETRRNISRMLLIQLPQKQRDTFASYIKKFCSVPEFVSSLIYATYKLLLTEKEELAEICATLPDFKCRKKDIRKIAYLTDTEFVNTDTQEFIYLTDNTDFKCQNKSVFYLAKPICDSHESVQARVDSIQKAIEKCEIDLVIDLRQYASFLTADALAVKSTGTPFMLQTDGNFVKNLNSHDLYILRSHLALFKTCKLFDGIIPGSSQDSMYFCRFGINCVDNTDYKDFLTKRNVSQKDPLFCTVIEELLTGITTHVQENRLGKELNASVDYAKQLEKQLSDAVNFGNDMEQGYIQSVAYAHELEEQIGTLRSNLLELESKQKAAEKHIEDIQQSKSYRLAQRLSAPIRKLKKLHKK